MNKFVFLLFFFFTNALVFSQSDVLKKEVFSQIEVFQRTKSIFKKESKKLSFNYFVKNSFYIPVIRFDYSLNSFDYNDNSFFVCYQDSFFLYRNNKVSMLSSDSFAKIVKNKYLENNDLILGYFLNDNDFNKNVFLTNKNREFIIDSSGLKIKNIDTFIGAKYKSLNKFLELEKIFLSQKKLKPEDIIQSIKVNYHLYENFCSADTTLVINSFVSQVKFALKDFSDEQGSDLKDKILRKLEIVRSERLKTEMSLHKNSYNVEIYGVDVLDELLSVITKNDYIQYIDFLDVYYPTVTGKKTRKTFGFELLVKEKIIDDNINSFSRYINEIILKEGCGQK